MEQNFNLKKAFLITLITSLSIGALIGILVFLLGDFGKTQIKLLVTTLVIGGYSLTGLCCSTLYEKRRLILLALSGILISILSLLYTVGIIWGKINMENDPKWKTLVILIILTLSTAHACLMLLIESDRALVNGSLGATVISLFIVALMLILLVMKKFEGMGTFYFRLLGVFAILDVLGTAVTPIMKKMYSIKN